MYEILGKYSLKVGKMDQDLNIYTYLLIIFIFHVQSLIQKWLPFFTIFCFFFYYLVTFVTDLKCIDVIRNNIVKFVF